MNMSNSSILLKVRNLLVKDHAPFVKEGPSTIAGRGVFATTTIPKDQVVALYPRIYSPPLPHFLQMPFDDSVIPTTELYLANKISPAGIRVEDNAYILNLPVGGFLDGACLTSARGRPLDENPSACGPFINHSANTSNVDFISFVWSDVVGDSLGDTILHDLPNERRQDGTPWYSDGHHIVRFPESDDLVQQYPHTVSGAVFVTKAVIDQGEELFLNYKLRKPYPNWAREWYTGS